MLAALAAVTGENQYVAVIEAASRYPWIWNEPSHSGRPRAGEVIDIRLADPIRRDHVSTCFIVAKCCYSRRCSQHDSLPVSQVIGALKLICAKPVLWWRRDEGV